MMLLKNRNFTEELKMKNDLLSEEMEVSQQKEVSEEMEVPEQKEVTEKLEVKVEFY